MGYKFYPRITDELVDKAGIAISDYKFAYRGPDGCISDLDIVGRRSITLVDPKELWQMKADGVILHAQVTIAYPDCLVGPDGIAPHGAELQPCILWSNRATSIAGAIKPCEILYGHVVEYRFSHVFAAGEITGDLTLTPILYLMSSAERVPEDESMLINETGVNLGEIGLPFDVDFDGTSMEFPIEEYEDEDGPLWKMLFEPWEDPKEDLFSEASFTLLLNTKHPDCPKINGATVSNQPLLQEIMAEAYFLIFEKVREFDDGLAWHDMISNTDLMADSICSVLHWFSERNGDEPFDWSTPESRMACIKRIVDLSFASGDDDE